jgi:hypothetical protein
MRSRAAVLVGVTVAGLAAASYAFVGLRLVPDWSSYTAPGLGLFPSPLGRLLGRADGWPLVAAGALSAGAVAALVVARARSVTAVVLALPVLVWVLPAGVDGLGAAAGALTLAGVRRPGLAAAASLLAHPVSAVVPVVEAVQARRKLVPLLVVAAGLLVAVVSPYRAVLVGGLTLRSVAFGSAIVAAAWLPALRVPARGELVGLVALAGLLALERGGAVTYPIECLRYGLPVALRAVLR